MDSIRVSTVKTIIVGLWQNTITFCLNVNNPSEVGVLNNPLYFLISVMVLIIPHDAIVIIITVYIRLINDIGKSVLDDTMSSVTLVALLRK